MKFPVVKFFILILITLSLGFYCSKQDSNNLVEAKRIDTLFQDFDDISKLKINNKIGNITIKADTTENYTIIITRVAEAETQEQADSLIESISYRKSETYKNLSFENDNYELPKNQKFLIYYDISLPGEVNLNIANTNGNITISDMKSDLICSNISGNLNLYNIHSDQIDYSCVNGTVDAELYPLDDPIDWQFSMANGSVDLDMDRDISAEVIINITNGSIDYDNLEFYVLESNGTYFGARLNEAKGKIRVNTINGNVYLYGI